MRLSFFFLLFFVFIGFSFVVQAAPTAIIYRSESCGHCVDYLAELKGLFAKQQIDFVERDIISDTEALRELDAFTRERNIPYALQGHMVVVLNQLVLEGHIPRSVLDELFSRYPDFEFPSLVLFQDSMDLFVTEYKILDEEGVKNCSTDKSLLACQEQSSERTKNISGASFFLFVAFNALLAGIHPCTLTVLLFFIAFLLTLHAARVKIVRVGVAYIVGIFLAYLGIGVGILKAVSFTGSPHLAAKVGAVFIFLLGVLNLLGYFFPKHFSLGLPRFVKPTIAQLLERATVPAAFLVGLLVGICSFGCTAGIYLSVISLLLVQAQYVSGLFALLLYNLMFILPLIVILLLASNKNVVARLEKMESHQQRILKLISGIVMILLALFLLWLTGGGR